MKIDASRAHKVLLMLAVVLLVASLFMPAMRANYGRQPVLIPGWAAMLLSFAAGAGTLDDALTGIASLKPLYLLPFLAALSNLNFIVTGVCLYRRRGKGSLPRWLPPATLCGLILAIVSPFVLQSGEIIRPGFYVWLLAHACLVAAVVSARHAHHKTHR
ncbi:hypothetical protein QPK31_09855 [Massilia sp. YIM B02769]|uniref:hypothetical protein n=1 Tax=Massilia sp. YIM B02769 TaxID=3050129 RepID=UPI0025B67436|nr:hypothetical protein [Massilia sp. YIM B02769]MDN4058523.1 hypothetical protein [Massilia sp. YIM B02769]